VTTLYTLYGPDEGEDPRLLRAFMQMRGFRPTGEVEGRLQRYPILRCDLPAPPRDPSLFIGLRLSAADRRRLARSATDPADDLHVTMTFHGKVSKLPADAHARAVRAVQAVARSHGPVSARVLRSARFEGPEQDVVYAALRAPGVVKLRTALATALSAEGLAPDATHAYTPHVTLGKVPHGAPWPPPEPPAVDLAFGSIYVWVGRVFRSIPLRGRP
jgi:2'-5' RNA ligase